MRRYPYFKTVRGEGGGLGPSDIKKALTTFSFNPLPILRKSNDLFQSKLYFSKVREGVEHFPGGGGPTFSRGGGPIDCSVKKPI